MTQTATDNCLVCRTPLSPALYPELTHAGCSPTLMFDEPAGPNPGNADPFERDLKRELLKVILWAENENPRSKQRQIGPSEIGNPCDRAIAYRLTNAPACNRTRDPWPATVGTAVHKWLERAFTDWCVQHRRPDWVAEQTLQISPDIIGHSDLYHAPTQTVIDWKTAGPDVMRKVRDRVIPPKYQIQKHIYGYGFARLGWPVKKVALAFVPRSGWIKDMVVVAEDYDQGVAEVAFARLYQVAQTAAELNPVLNPHRFQQIESTPGDDCGFCPWFNSMRTAEEGADLRGCPGH